LSQVLGNIPRSANPNVLVDFHNSDDAGVYVWEGGQAIVQTVDFFTPIVDDPYVYGQIAAANSLSDVYAMGGKPLTALAIACFPKAGLQPGLIAEVFRGGYDKLSEAGVALLGGHTVEDPEIKFGYAVTGAIERDRIWSNAGARAGDLVFLTKPIGTGIVTTAVKSGRAPEALAAEVIEAMRTLNRAAAEALIAAKLPVHSCTDVTGFGLIGHACEVAVASGVTLLIQAARVPLFAGVRELVANNRNAGISSNRSHFGNGVIAAEGVPAELMDLLYDPQTSGGLLAFVAPDAAAEAAAAFASAGVTADEIGRAVAQTGNVVEVA
jgi:selenide,water dikinase